MVTDTDEAVIARMKVAYDEALRDPNAGPLSAMRAAHAVGVAQSAPDGEKE